MQSVQHNLFREKNPVSPSVVMTAGVNPAHGQPGHRCDIAVGAPLNSKLATPKITSSDEVSKEVKEQPSVPMLLSTSSVNKEETIDAK